MVADMDTDTDRGPLRQELDAWEKSRQATARIVGRSRLSDNLPGVTYEKDWPDGEVKGEQERRAVYDRNGQYVGSVVYVKRRRKLPAPVTHTDGFVQTHETTFGWRPVKAAPQSKLTDCLGAVMRLPNLTRAEAIR